MSLPVIFMSGKYYPKELKEEIINKIKSEGITGIEASNRYGISVKNIYRWLSSGIGGGSNGQILENNRNPILDIDIIQFNGKMDI